MLDKTTINHITMRIYLTMPWPKGPDASTRYKIATRQAKELALAEWSRMCHEGDPRISLTDDVIPGKVASIEDGAIVCLRMEGSSQGYKEIGGVNIPGHVRRELKASQAKG